MYFLLLLSLVLFNSDEKILEQGESFVPISDMDAYVYLLLPEKRSGFINDKHQMEKNLITMMNINIVDNYIKTNDLENHKVFNDVEELINQKSVDLDDDFYIKMGLDKQTAYDSVRNFLIKKERFVRMSKFIENQMLNGGIDNYLNEYFIINKKDYIKPENRDISLIKLDVSKYETLQAKKILEDLLKNDDFNYFSEAADKYSNDESVQLNHGHLKKFQQERFSYPFADYVFTYESEGVVPRIFKYDGHLYLIRINEIIEEQIPVFADYKEKLKTKLLPDLVDEKLQRIIDSQAKFKIKVNEEVAAHVFERYNALIED